jgi:hypothetical protein
MMTMSKNTYRARVVLEFFVEANSAEEVEPAVKVFMNHIAEADQFLESPYSWEFADWQITEVADGDELGECDTCGKPYELASRDGRCGDCGNCSDHCTD